ncbi:hypothetical protein GW17_00007824 [Ensete ventricosum]|nr:hypothetical protein GW17_00007824 [Ensete ventricosum]RZR85654.1 hypothetical protein BHM03_00012672 [Ensete ventricosum]
MYCPYQAVQGGIENLAIWYLIPNGRRTRQRLVPTKDASSSNRRTRRRLVTTQEDEAPPHPRLAFQQKNETAPHPNEGRRGDASSFNG